MVMTEGIPWDWETFPEYLDALDRRRMDIDFAAQLPHSPLRVYVMDERGASLEPPTWQDLDEMRRITSQAIRAGAIGVSTSRAFVHHFADGRPAPSVNTGEEELVALADGLKDAGSGVFQLIPSLERPAADEFALIGRLHERSGRPVSFTLVQNEALGWRTYLQGVRRAAAAGIPIRAQFFPRPVGVLFGLNLSMHPFSLNPSYQPLADLPLHEKSAAMRDNWLKVTGSWSRSSIFQVLGGTGPGAGKARLPHSANLFPARHRYDQRGSRARTAGRALDGRSAYLGRRRSNTRQDRQAGSAGEWPQTG